MARVLRVFVASPGDVLAERSAMGRVIADLNDTLGEAHDFYLRLVTWETHAWPGFGRDAQDVINGQIAPYDIFVGVMWSRLGTPTGRAASGTVEEFHQAYERWRTTKRPHLMFYFRNAPVEITSQDAAAQYRSVLEFKAELERLGALLGEYQDVSDFGRIVHRHLHRHLTAMPAETSAGAGWKATPRHAAGWRRVIALSHPQGTWELDFRYRYLVASLKINGRSAGTRLKLGGAEEGEGFVLAFPDGREVPGRVTYTVNAALGTFPRLALWLDDQCVYVEDNRKLKRFR